MRAIAMAEAETKVDIFDQYRTRLFGIAYRMLGTRADAEDVLQEAYIRWHKTDEAEIETPEAWLTTVVTRLSIDRLRKLAADRESYIGPWLPEPLIVDPARSPHENAEMSSDLSVAFMVMLERLAPAERAVLLLRDVFDFEYPAIAGVIGKTETAVRQMISRARSRVRDGKQRFQADRQTHSDLIRKFSAASFAGDQQTLLSIFSDDIQLISDGGGRVAAARRIVVGAERIARVFSIPFAKYREHLEAKIVLINGEPGLLEFADGQPLAATSFSITDGRISDIYRVMNPEKLASIDLENGAFGKVSQTDGPVRL